MRALDAVAGIGPFFAWDELPGPPAGDWRPLADLADPDDPDVLAGRVALARRHMAAGRDPDAVPVRVAASIFSLGVFSRLVSAPLAAVALAEELPAPRRDQLWWRAVDGGPLPVAVAGRGPAGCGPAGCGPAGCGTANSGTAGIAVIATDGMDDDAVAAAFAEIVVDGLVGPLLAAVRRRFRVSPKVLRGNVASALGGAVTVLAGARPDRVDRARRVVDRLLAREPLAGAAVVRRPPWRLRRNNCCLYYRLPGGGYCGDCVLVNR